MEVSIVNKSTVVEFTDDSNTVRSIPKPYVVTINIAQSVISIRNELTAVSYDYADIVLPESNGIEELRDILISYLSDEGTLVDGRDLVSNQQVAEPVSLADYSFRYNLRTSFFSSGTSGTGAVTHDSTVGAANLAVTSNNDFGVITTNQSHRYIAGFPIEVEITTIGFNAQTNVVKQICYGSRDASSFANGFDGIRLVAKSGTHYFEGYNNGTENFSIARADWTDPLDGTGRSGVDLGDFSDFCVFGIQFIWLGGAGAALFCYGNGTRYLAHLMPWSFHETALIMKHPQQPIQAAISSTGGSGSFKFVCSAVKTFGQPEIQRGDERAVGTPNAGVSPAAAPSLTALFGIRLKAAFENAIIEPIGIENLGEGANDPFRWYLILNPTVAGVFTYADSSQTESCWQQANGTSSNTVTGGLVLASGLFQGRAAESHPLDFVSRKIGFAFDGTADTLVLAVEPLSAGVSAINTVLTFRQSY